MSIEAEPLPSLEYLRSRLDYNPKTGVLTWRPKPGDSREERRWNSRYAGKPTGHLRPDGYLEVNLDYRLILAHRIAYALGKGKPIPESYEVDHRNRKRSDNKLRNLRLATNVQNSCNGSGRQNVDPSIPRGVSWHRGAGKWQARLRVYGRRLHLGSYHDLSEASRVVEKARKKYHKEFAYSKEVDHAS